MLFKFETLNSQLEQFATSKAEYMHDYEEGDRVAIVLDGSQQMGMPHRRFHGRTGFIQKRQGVAWVVSVKDGNMQKTVIARPEHLRPLE